MHIKKEQIYRGTYKKKGSDFLTFYTGDSMSLQDFDVLSLPFIEPFFIHVYNRRQHSLVEV